MVTNRKSREKNLKRLGLGALLVALLGVLIITLAAPVAKADNANDLAKALDTQKYYVSDAVKNDKTTMDRNPNLEQNIKETVNRLKGKQDTRIAVLSNAIIPSQYGTAKGATESYGKFLYGYLNQPSVLVLVNAQSSEVSLLSDKLSASERQTIINDSLSTFNSRGLAAGATMVADKAVDKIASNETSGTITTLLIVVVVVLAIAGGIAYMLISTKKNWKQKVSGLEQLANSVSDQVVKVSDDVNFLPDASRQQADAAFGAATQNFSEANTRLRELQKVSPVTLLLKGPEYQRKLDLTAAQFEQARQGLARVEQQVRSLPGY